jgi:transposase
MKAYSADLCAKIAQACDEGRASRRQLARQFHVSVAFIQKMLRRRRLTGRRAAAPHTGGRRAVLDAAALALGASLGRAQNDLTLVELCERIAAARGVHVSVPTMYRAVRRLRLPSTKSCSLPLSVTPRACRPNARSTAT